MPAPKPLTRLIEHIHQALRAQLHHSPDHPAARKAEEELEAFLPGVLGELGAFTLVTNGVGFSWQDQPVTGAPNAAMALARELEAREIGGLEFRPGLDPEELRTLLFILQMRPQRVAEMGGAATLLPDDGPLRVLPMEALSTAPVDSPLRASDVELDWDRVFAADAPAFEAEPVPEPLSVPASPLAIPDTFDPIPWVTPASPAAAEPGLPATMAGGFPETLPMAYPGVPAPASLDPAPDPEPPSQPPLAAPEPPSANLSPAALRDELASLLRAALQAPSSVDKAGPRSPWGVDHREALNRFGFAIPDFSGLAGAGERLRLERVDPGTVRDALRKACGEFSDREQGDLLLGLPAFPPGEYALRRGLDFLAPEFLAQAVAHTHVTHRPSLFDLALLTVALLQCVPDRDLSLEAIRGRLQFEGWGMQEMEDFKEAIQWECQGTDTKLHLSLERHAIHKLDPHLVMTLGRQIIRANRVDDLRSMLAQLEEELVSPQESVRRHGTEILANLADGLAGSALPADLENRVLAAARDRLSAENDQLVAQWCAQCVEAILNRWLASGNFLSLYDEMRNFGDLAYPAVGAAAWKPQLLRDLLARLGSPANVQALIQVLYQKGSTISVPQVHAVLGLMGAPAASQMAAALEEEDDPGRRAHLVEALKALGARAVPVLRELLGSPRWDLVDDALMLLAQTGDASVLPDLLLAVSHQDARVRHTAVMAVSGLAGKAVAARALGSTLADADLPSQLEALSLLGDLGDPAALPAILPLLAPERLSGEEAQRLRLRVVEVLGRIPGNESIKPLQELFQKKGLFKGREPVGLRLAAAKALAGINTLEAREAMALAMESEPTEEVRAVLRQYLVR